MDAPAKIAALLVTADEDGIRLDRWLRRHFPLVTQGQIQKLLRTGQVRVEGKRAEASTRLASGQAIRIPPQLARGDLAGAQSPKPAARQADKLKKLVIFEDADIVVLNKPAGLAVQGGTGLKENLDDALMAFSLDGTTKPKLVHRLDRDTSGVLLIARTAFAATRLAAAFRARDTQKIYWALTVGIPKPDRGWIDVPLYRAGEIMRVATEKRDDAKDAATRYDVVERVARQAAFVALWPVTGRTHQLRVHLAHIGTPILGDRLYNGIAPENWAEAEIGNGLHLHARRLIIPHPRRGVIDISAPLSAAMVKTFRWFGFNQDAAVDFEDLD